MKYNTITQKFSKNLFLGWLFSVLLFTGFSVNAQTQKGSDIDGAGPDDWLGYSVAMGDANTFAVGAPGNNATGAYSGAVKVYSWNGTSWTQKGSSIYNPMGGAGSLFQFGYAVSMPDANTVAIGSRAGFNGTGTPYGHVVIYSWDGSAWVQKGQDLYGETDGEGFGTAISMPDANTIAVTAPLNDNFANNAGYLKVYSYNGSTWVQKGTTLYGEAMDDFAGNSVSMPDANTVAFGGHQNDGSGNAAGHARIYSWNGTAWVQKGLDIEGEAANDLFGWSVSMPDASTIAVGAKLNDGSGANSGHVRVYSWNGSSWVQKGTDLDGEAANDEFGHWVSMPNANTIAISALNNSGAGPSRGHVRIFSWNGTNWTQNGIDIDGEGNIDNFGHCISIKDANTIAISTPNNDGNGVNAGHARVYTLCQSTSNTISPTACVSYTSPSSNYTWTQSGTYSDVIPNAAGCDSVITINLTINTVDVTTTNNDPQLVAGATGASYQWLDCTANYAEINGATSQTFTATTNGTYAVEVTMNGCSDTSACEVISTLDLMEDNVQLWQIYPNPVNEMLQISPAEGVFVTIVDAEGREMYSATIDSAHQLSVSTWRPGVYFVTVTKENGTASIKRFTKL